MSETLSEYIRRRLSEAEAAGLRRTLRVVEDFDGAEVTVAGRKYISFASNDYLGLARHPDIVASAKAALEKYGAGAGASRLVIGDLAIHHELEDCIARFKGREAARLFATGYLANIGAVCALVGPGDAIISDEKNHSSIIDACRLSRAKILIYRHVDMDSLREKLEEAKDLRNRLVITESVFSIDGDIAPVNQVAQLAKEFGAWSMIDEAHATGIVGEKGRGAEELFNCTGAVDIVMGTLSKAVASQGGFIAGGRGLMDLLINASRTLIYSTGLAPAAAAAAKESLGVMEREPQRRKRLFENVARINQMATDLSLRDQPSETPIIPLVIGDEKDAVKAFEMLLEKGLIVPVMRYPTVPKSQAVLRISLSCEHTTEHLNRLTDALATLI
jgi:8-amino-7-oxononanoate synthase